MNLRLATQDANDKVIVMDPDDKVSDLLANAGAGAADLLKNVANLTVEDVVVLYAYAEAIVETVREPLIILGSDMSIKTANKAFFEMFRVTKEETYGKNIFELGDGQWDIPKLRTLLLEVLPRDSHMNDFEVTHDFESVGTKTMLLNARRIELEKHKTQLILLAMEDITHRKSVDRVKDDFIGVVAHELRTPLSSIKTLIDTLLLDTSGEDEERLNALTIVDQQVDLLGNLINGFTDLYRLQTGKLVLKKSSFDINEMIDGVIKMFRTTTKSHLLLRDGTASRNLVADRMRIEQVLINLLSNAIKYSPKSDKVRIIVQQTAHETTIAVQDFGIGIAKDKISKVHERLYRVADDASTRQGLGLGLYIAREIVRDHGGTLTIKSTPDKGSTVTFTVPDFK